MRALLVCMTLVIASALPARAADLLIVQSSRSPVYAEALSGFRNSWQGSSRTFVLSDYVEVDVVRLVKEEQPLLVLAVGDQALEACRKVRQVPVVALMALSFNVQKPPSGNISGVGSVASPASFLQTFRKMGARRVGVLYDPSRTGHYLKRARQAAQQLQIELVAEEVRSPKEALNDLERLAGRVDALWMLPDATAVTAETLEAYFFFSMKQKVPLFTFSARHLPKGATASIEGDRAEMGRQAAELAKSLLKGGAPPAVDPRRTIINSNRV